MRITDISPVAFGKPLSTLTIPQNDFVVIYGKNEAGKSTYLDLATSLLSKRTDVKILRRHMSTGSQLRGSVRIRTDRESLQISFETGATLKKNTVDTPRLVDDPDSELWKVLKELDSAVIRNIFRVDSVELIASIQNGISEGVEFLRERFLAYASGDRRGVDYQALVHHYREIAKNNIEAKQERFSGRDELLAQLQRIEQEIRAASTTQLQAEGFDSTIAVLESKKEKIRSDNEQRELESTALEVSSSLQETYVKRLRSETELKSLEAKGELRDVELPTIVPILQDHLTSLSEIAKRNSLANAHAAQEDLRSKQTRISQTAQLRGLNPDNREQLHLISGSDRERRNAELLTAIGTRESKRKEMLSLNIPQQRAEVKKQTLFLQGLEEEWGRLGTRNSNGVVMEPEEYLNSPAQRISVSTSDVPPDTQRNVLLATGFGASIAGAIGLPDWSSAVAFLVAGALFWFAFKEIRKTKEQIQTQASESLDAVSTRDSALEIVRIRKQLNEDRARLAGDQERLKSLEAETEIECNRINAILKSWNQAAAPEISRDEALTVKRDLDELAKAFADLLAAESTVDITTEKLKEDRESFAGLSQQVSALLEPFSVNMRLSEEGDIELAVSRMEALIHDISSQKELRDSVNSYDLAINQVPSHLRKLVEQCLVLDNSKRESRRKDISEARIAAATALAELDRQITDASSQKQSLERDAKLPRLREQAESLRVTIRNRELKAALASVQAAILEKYVSIRQEDNTPLLERQVEQIGMRGAPEWRGVRRVDDGTFFVRQGDVEIRDTELSAGALTVLFMAIRLAMIQSEDAREGSVKIPFLCDDPLLHLDESRTAHSFKMMVNELRDRQTLYFTCKVEIKALAESLSVPVISI